MWYEFDLNLTFDLHVVTVAKIVIFCHEMQPSWHFAWRATFHSNSLILWLISTKLSHNYPWNFPHMWYQFDSYLTFDLVTVTKYVILPKNASPPTCFVWFHPNLVRSISRSVTTKGMILIWPQSWPKVAGVKWSQKFWKIFKKITVFTNYIADWFHQHICNVTSKGPQGAHSLGVLMSLRGHFRSKTKNLQTFLFQNLNIAESHNGYICINVTWCM